MNGIWLSMSLRLPLRCLFSLTSMKSLTGYLSLITQRPGFSLVVAVNSFLSKRVRWFLNIQIFWCLRAWLSSGVWLIYRAMHVGLQLTWSEGTQVNARDIKVFPCWFHRLDSQVEPNCWVRAFLLLKLFCNTCSFLWFFLYWKWSASWIFFIRKKLFEFFFVTCGFFSSSWW